MKIDLKKSENLLKELILHFKANPWKASSDKSNLIKNVILGTHKTYRYILFNALLAKAAEGRINPLTLQAGSKLDGAYDARSLCHKVVVPVERELLEGRLGESNEPFLNKPARFTELSMNNAVRKGSDMERLSETISILTGISQDEALACLKDSIYFIFQRDNRNITSFLDGIDKKHSEDSHSIIKLIEKLSEKSFEGEMPAIISGVALNILLMNNFANLKITVHPVNQSGASSKEVADIGVFDGKKLVLATEVKDKLYTREDVEHAINKVIRSKHNNLLFVHGNNSEPKHFLHTDLKQIWLEKDFILEFISVQSLIKLSLMSNPLISFVNFAELLFTCAKEARIKDETFDFLKRTIH